MCREWRTEGRFRVIFCGHWNWLKDVNDIMEMNAVKVLIFWKQKNNTSKVVRKNFFSLSPFFAPVTAHCCQRNGKESKNPRGVRILSFETSESFWIRSSNVRKEFCVSVCVCVFVGKDAVLIYWLSDGLEIVSVLILTGLTWDSLEHVSVILGKENRKCFDDLILDLEERCELAEHFNKLYWNKKMFCCVSTGIFGRKRCGSGWCFRLEVMLLYFAGWIKTISFLNLFLIQK